MAQEEEDTRRTRKPLSQPSLRIVQDAETEMAAAIENEEGMRAAAYHAIDDVVKLCVSKSTQVYRTRIDRMSKHNERLEAEVVRLRRLVGEGR